jgi:hypothetical protein
VHGRNEVGGLAGARVAQPRRKATDVDAGDGTLSAEHDRATGEPPEIRRMPHAEPGNVGQARCGTDAAHGPVC